MVAENQTPNSESIKTNEYWNFGSISIWKMIYISDSMILSPFIEIFFSEIWQKILILLIRLDIYVNF